MSFPRVQPRPPSAHPTSPARAGGGRFAEALRQAEQVGEPSGAGQALRSAARSITRGGHLVDSVIRAARRGKTFSNEELLAVQAGVYRYTQELELASKLIDKASGAVRTTLQSQQ